MPQPYDLVVGTATPTTYTAGKFGDAISSTSGAHLVGPVFTDYIGSDWTIGVWVFFTGTGEATARNRYAIQGGSGAASAIGLGVYTTTASGGPKPLFLVGTLTYNYSATPIPLNQWVYLEMAKTGTTVRMFMDGVQLMSTSGLSTVPNWTTGFVVGAAQSFNGNNRFLGYIDELVISKVSRRTSSTTYTPPTDPWVADADTLALYRFNGTILDSSLGDAGAGTPATVVCDAPATASALALDPVVVAAVIIAPPVVSATGVSLAPDVVGPYSGVPPPATGTASAPTPVLTRTPVIAAPAATVSVAVRTPSVGSASGETVEAPTATASVTVPAPVPSVPRTIAAPAVPVTAAALPPAVARGVSVQAPTAAGSATAGVPTLTCSAVVELDSSAYGWAVAYPSSAAATHPYRDLTIQGASLTGRFVSGRIESRTITGTLKG